MRGGVEVSSQPSVVWEAACELGEGPVWIEDQIWFVDIKGRQVYAFEPRAGKRLSWRAPEPVGFVQPLPGGAFVAGLKSGLHTFDPSSGAFSKFSEVEPAALDNRLNDGAVDQDGYLWFGSMHDPETKASGALYRLDADGACRVRDADYVVTNGPAFSPDGRTLYHTDTLSGVIHAFDRSDDGRVSNRRVFVRIEREGVYPDGPVVDSEGCLWTGLFGGWGAERYAPSGEKLAFVEFPCSRVTKIAFGGPDLKTAYATTAWLGLGPEQRAREPLAGALFAFEVDVPGLPAPRITRGVSL
jgi:xylono-1,5-lactonase